MIVSNIYFCFMGQLTAFFPIKISKAAQRLATTEQSVVTSCTKLQVRVAIIIPSLSMFGASGNSSLGLLHEEKFSIWDGDSGNEASSLQTVSLNSHSKQPERTEMAADPLLVENSRFEARSPTVEMCFHATWMTCQVDQVLVYRCY